MMSHGSSAMLLILIIIAVIVIYSICRDEPSPRNDQAGNITPPEKQEQEVTPHVDTAQLRIKFPPIEVPYTKAHSSARRGSPIEDRALVIDLQHRATRTRIIQSREAVLFIDCETTGLPSRNHRNSSFHDTNVWPRIVSIAWILADSTGILVERETLIRPAGFIIPSSATAIHGITTEAAINKGLDLKIVLNQLLKDCDRYGPIQLTAHNVKFDRPVVCCEFVRMGLTPCIANLRWVCTMLSSTEFCNLRGYRGRNKWPKLDELHYKLFNTNVARAHDAMSDLRATVRCYQKLCQLGILEGKYVALQ